MQFFLLFAILFYVSLTVTVLPCPNSASSFFYFLDCHGLYLTPFLLTDPPAPSFDYHAIYELRLYNLK
jgi:hypothetical protein